jgi:hypothetical protein
MFWQNELHQVEPGNEAELALDTSSLFSASWR